MGMVTLGVVKVLAVMLSCHIGITGTLLHIAVTHVPNLCHHIGVTRLIIFLLSNLQECVQYVTMNDSGFLWMHRASYNNQTYNCWKNKIC